MPHCPLPPMTKACLAGSVLVLACMFSGCSSVPRPVDRPPSSALADTARTKIGRLVAPDLADHPGHTAFYPVPLGAEAFAARVALIRAAERSLDVQYYILHDDDTGRTLLAELLHAADRGVRVRLLLDDIHTKGEDARLAALDAHPNIEVRIFNPFHHRSARWVDFIFDYSRVNRRMHNKSLTADNQLTIVGGRNIGNEYFGADSTMDFSDLDVLAAGPVVPKVSAAFDDYWNSPVVFPILALTDPPTEDAIRETRVQLEESLKSELNTAYARALPDLDLVKAIRAGNLEAFWSDAMVIADQPAKVTLPPKDDSTHAVPQLKRLLESAHSELFLVSPYFVPGKKGAEWLESLAQRGIRVRILTNSFLATDVRTVHAGYMSYRKRLLRAKIEIYELKPSPNSALPEDKDKGIAGSQASLHAKTYLVDRNEIFIGSLNFDPRSARLNTEMGIVVESAELGQRFVDKFDAGVLDFAYRVELDPKTDNLSWTTREQGKEVRVDSEPGVGPLRSFGLFLQRILPVEDQL